MHGGSLRAKAIRSVQMKQKKKILWMLLPVLIFVGCGTQDSILKRGQPETGSLEEQQDTETVYNVESETQDEKPEQEEKPLQEWIYVDVCGAVRNPGVYRIEAGSRVFQVLEQAGGCTEKASLETVNQADLLTDGQKIRIYTKEEAGQMEMGVAGTENYGTVNAYNVENSNVDMATEMVNMIITQRGFQSNSKVVTTADQMLQKAMELKR